MDKTYFNYEEKLRSKSLVEAMSLPHGFGPFCGFGGHTIDNNNIIITSEPLNDNPEDRAFYKEMYSTIHNRLVSHRVSLERGINVNFGCISKDGYIYVSGASKLELPIEGSRGVNSDVIVIAIHTQVEEPVENPVSFRAFWSQSSTSFYELYKKSLDIYYPKSKETRTFNDNINISEYSFDKLESMAKSAIGNLISWDNATMNLIGIYGLGNDMMNDGAQENYRIIPYDSKFPLQITDTVRESYIRENLNILKRFLGNLPETNENLITYLDNILNRSNTTPTQGTTVVNQSLPKGSIILWYGNQSNIPYGWELCDGGTSVNDPGFSKPNLMGRVVVGLSTGNSYNNPGAMGGSETVTLNENNLPKHRHVYTDDVNAAGKFTVDGVAFPTDAGYKARANSSADDDGGGTTYFTSYVGNNSPVSIMPPYCVVAYIIKTI